ncbi:MAG: serine/threonine transporter SstT [Candidatus Gastranaerophilaceae bacterium]|nr:serine/threonine transporter SstT [Candidatus Gastranaerophilaceae bacterium]
MEFKYLAEKYNNINIVVKIIIGIILGIVAAAMFPAKAWFGIPGGLFVGALKAIAPMLVFILVISSLANGVKKHDDRFRIVIFLYVISTLIAAFCSVVASFLFPIDLALNTQIADTQAILPHGVGDIIHGLLVKIVINPLSSLSEGNYLGILFWSIISGIALRDIAADNTKNMLNDFAKCTSKVVLWIINFAPFGIFGLVYSAISTNGTEIFITYGKLLLLLVGCMLFVYFVANPILIFVFTRRNPYPLIFRCFKDSGITAFFTRSSAANIPVNMALCEKLGLDKDLYAVSIPLGATINMGGAAVTISVMTMAAVHTLGIPVPFSLAVLLSILSAFAACGASGVAGGSLLLIPMACSLFGISNDVAMHVVGVGFIVGVIQDSLETALNSSSDVIFSAVADFHKKFVE